MKRKEERADARGRTTTKKRKPNPRKLSAAEIQAIEDRREKVAHLWGMQLSVRQIETKLANPGKDRDGNIIPPLCNPKTGKPWGKSAIQDDIEFIRATWRAEYSADIMEQRIKVGSEIEVLQKTTGDPKVKLACIQTKMKLWGLESPQKLAIGGPDGEELIVTVRTDRELKG